MRIFRLGEQRLIGVVVSLALLLPGIAVSARRLHDLDRTAWWLLHRLHRRGCHSADYLGLHERHDRIEPLRRRSARGLTQRPQAGADQLDRLVLAEQIEQVAQRLAARASPAWRRAPALARRRRAPRRDICRASRCARCGSRAGRFAACRAGRLRRAASNPPRRCGSRPRSRAASASRALAVSPSGAL